MAKPTPTPEPLRLTPLIDIVFQLIIFFIFTADLNQQVFASVPDLAVTPDVAPTDQVDPRTIYIALDQDGDARLINFVLSDLQLQGILHQVATRHGKDTPVVIRASKLVQHRSVIRVMQVVEAAGLHSISFAAIHKPQD